MRVSAFVALAAFCGLSVGVPTPQKSVHQALALTPRWSNSSCPGYSASNVQTTDSGLTADLTLAGPACNLYSEDLDDLKLVVQYQTDDRLHVFIYDAGLNQYQVQDQIFPRPQVQGGSASSAQLEFNITEDPFSFTVTRKSNGEVLFDTSGAQLIFESQYIRLRTKLPDNPNLYGLGEHTDPFRLPTQDYHRTLWNSENPDIPVNNPLYGSHNVYFDHRGAKGTHGVFLLNANGMDINITSTDDDGQYLEYNAIGGVFDFYFLAGSKPSDVSKQVAEVVGFSAMFPYWTFGFHQCRYGYWDVNMVAEVVGNYSTANIPLESVWTDLDYMDGRQDFTLDPLRFPLHKMQELTTTLHQRGQKYIVILDPGIHQNSSYATYTDGQDADVFLKNADGSEYTGVQWSGITVWPDWFAPGTQGWWTNEIQKFFSETDGVNVDGLWVDMNEVSNFCPNIQCNRTAQAQGNPPTPAHAPRPNTGRVIPGFPADFQPNGTTNSTQQQRSLVQARHASPVLPRAPASSAPTPRPMGQMGGMPGRNLFYPGYRIQGHYDDISDNTLWTNVTNYDGTVQYDTHNLHGLMMANATRNALLTRRPGKRPFVLTRSTFSSTGRVATHWFGDNNSTWWAYETTIRQMLAFVSMHQMPMVGSDVCGFNADAEPNMCARWATLGAFQPFYRNHAEISTIQQEFYQWPETIAAAKKAIDTRYKLLDYAYTGLYYQTANGEPWIKPMWFLYPEDENTYAIQTQWFYGDALLVSPVMDESDDVTFYLPEGIWYDYYSFAKYNSTGQTITHYDLDLSDITVHIRGGSIIPQRSDSGNTTTQVRQQPFTIVVAPDENGIANGTLYLDDGESLDQAGTTMINFTFSNGTFSSSGTYGYKPTNGESFSVEKVLIIDTKTIPAGDSGTSDTGSVTTCSGNWQLTGSFTVDDSC